MSDNQSPERIAADILIAMMSSGQNHAHQKLAQPKEAVAAYKELFKAVHNARSDANPD